MKSLMMSQGSSWLTAHCLLVNVILMSLSISICHASVNKCKNRLDLAIIIDATSSETETNFLELKSQVKAIVSDFKIGSEFTRLALVSASRKVANVVATFEQINSLADFNSAVDRVTLSPGQCDLLAGLRTARQSVLSSARTLKVSKILLLVKDRRQPLAEIPGPSTRARIATEAAGLRSASVDIQAVGIGGMWLSEELVALFGTEYLLFKDINKAKESIKSLNNKICEASCPDAGKNSVKSGNCYLETKQTFSTTVRLTEDSNRLSVCRKGIQANFESCSTTSRCDRISREVGVCNSANGKVEVKSSWQTFDFKMLECVTNTAVSVVDCKDAQKCSGQVADIIFILDTSSSLADLFHHVKEATRTLMQPLDVGPNSARVALMTFDNWANIVVSLAASTNLVSLLAALDRIPNKIDYYGKLTFTNLALAAAADEFQRNGRISVPRFVFLITDGASTRPSETFAATSQIKNQGVTLYVIGVGQINETELREITAPESATNLFILKQITQLESWAVEFAKRICIKLSAPDPKLCEDNIFVQTISECSHGRQQITKTEYVYDSQRKCIKSVHSQLFQQCRSKCIDPINGNEYFERDSWQTRCHEFHCGSSQPKPFLPHKSSCVSADGACKPLGSHGFNCFDDKGIAFTNCQCLEKNGQPMLVVDTY